MESVESGLERRPRATLGAVAEQNYSPRPCGSPFRPLCYAQYSKLVPDSFVNVGAERRRPHRGDLHG